MSFQNIGVLRCWYRLVASAFCCTCVLTVNCIRDLLLRNLFRSSIYGQLGVLEVDDMAAGAAYLLKHNIAIESQIFLTGRSYGGYLTLQAAGRRPDLWAAGMGVVAIADWALMYEDQADTLRGYQRALFRGSPTETQEATRVASPISYAAAVQAPLLVQQGANDTRCPRRQMEGLCTCSICWRLLCACCWLR